MTGTGAAAGPAALRAEVLVRRPGLDVRLELEAAPGEVVAVMGPSGAGKSTLLGALAGSERLDAGRIEVGDAVLADAASRTHVPPHRRGVGLLGQRPHLFPHLTAAANIAFAARAAGRTRAEADAVGHRWLERLGLAALAGRTPDRLSGGQAQRVALARTLAAGPRLLLLDEPFTALDVLAAEQLRGMLLEHLREHATTTVLVSHDVDDARGLAERLVVLEDGAVTARGPWRDVLAAAPTDFVAALGRAALRAGADDADPAG